MADFIDYFLQFANRGAAQRDPIVGPLITAGGTGGTNEILIYQGNVDSVDALGGYCIQVPQVGTNAQLASHPNLLLINDATQYRLGLPSVSFSKLKPVSGLIVIVDAFGPYAIQTLRESGVVVITFYLLQEDGVGRIILENGSGFLELESAP